METKKLDFSKILIYIVLLIGVVITIAPFIWMILTSLKTQHETMKIPIAIFPKKIIWQNYPAVFQKIPFAKMYWNTIVSAGATVIAHVIICSMAAYAFARIKFPGRDAIFLLLLSILMIPQSFFILPQYSIIQKMGLLNTIPALFIPQMFSAFGTFLLRQFFMSLPKELEDSANLDGCNPFMTYLFIMLPLVKSGLVALSVITLRYAWNNLMWPLVVNTSPEKMTLPAGLSYLQGQFVTEYPTMMAGAVLSVIPLLVVFAIFQKQFIEGIALSGIK